MSKKLCESKDKSCYLYIYFGIYLGADQIIFRNPWLEDGRRLMCFVLFVFVFCAFFFCSCFVFFFKCINKNRRNENFYNNKNVFLAILAYFQKKKMNKNDWWNGTIAFISFLHSFLFMYFHRHFFFKVLQMDNKK